MLWKTSKIPVNFNESESAAEARTSLQTPADQWLATLVRTHLRSQRLEVRILPRILDLRRPTSWSAQVLAQKTLVRLQRTRAIERALWLTFGFIKVQAGGSPCQSFRKRWSPCGRGWYVALNGKQLPLGKREARAFKRYDELMCQPRAADRRS